MKGWFFLIAGAALLIGAAMTTLGVRRFLARAATAPGQVVRLNAGSSHPQIAFVTRAGEHVSYPQNGWVAGYAVGDRVDVIYDPADARRDPTVDSVGAVWAWPIALAFLGLGFAVGGLLELAGRRH